MDKLSKKLDKFYTQVHNQKKINRSHSKEYDDLSDTSIDIQINHKKQEKNTMTNLKED
ncbi:unnamed protein product [Paramecium octaurelia]|uniref:Uncharacterized protein n=1 Tax=Paramecium octaurelia TaxID=43137 RepID=A0A8S1WRF7_PAROT|nr:unnamed protein product [Paramecium octaurelia]